MSHRWQRRQPGRRLHVAANHRDQVGFAALLSYKGIQEDAKIGCRLFRAPPINELAETFMSVLHRQAWPPWSPSTRRSGTLIGEGQLMAEPFAFANDGFPLGFTFLVELIDILDRSPVCNVACLPFPEEAVEHATAGQ